MIFLVSLRGNRFLQKQDSPRPFRKNSRTPILLNFVQNKIGFIHVAGGGY